ncbi:retron St85 family RNA-directed DNA polymerase [Burkholderia gladioli]|uniref:retron St85 family RNA-directed DNA polymerase n=1 Tax=Burkholderia gladioli TaxID=28095 RepID=UPI0009B9F835|nr:retron St85 family RNA-directed DNA polymerase [Burkholderia gladioli]
MKNARINESLLLWAVGVIQPASPGEVIAFIERVTQSQFPPGVLEGVTAQCSHYVARGLLREVNKRRNWYSLTYEAELRIPKRLRRRRDRIRLFLLKGARAARMRAVGVPHTQKSVDVSSTSRTSGGEDIQEVPRPTKSFGRGERAQERFPWPRIFEQISDGSGSATGTPTHSDSSNATNPLAFYTFSGRHRAAADNPYPLNVRELGLAIGVSARLLTSIGKFPNRHYRRFQIPKANGTNRDIASPRIFLKTIQYWIKDYLLYRLPVHETCYSFISGVSIEDNAACHAGKNFVATIDIRDFFGSITLENVQTVMRRAGHTISLARIVAKLVTLDGSLPQGAPTSPIISNSYLFDFDRAMSMWCAKRGCSYTRYADDITISGETRSEVQRCVDHAEYRLNRYGLRLNEGKTRLQSRGARQVVTGLVVNELAQPSREQRRMVRAMLHRYQTGIMREPTDIARLRGWISYFHSFEHLREKFPRI